MGEIAGPHGGAPVAQPGVPPAILAFTDLTAEQRAALPPVNVTGSTYSERAALRTLIVNGQVLQEGDEIAPGLRLEAIEKQSAVLNHRGLEQVLKVEMDRVRRTGVPLAALAGCMTVRAVAANSFRDYIMPQP